MRSIVMAFSDRPSGTAALGWHQASRELPALINSFFPFGGKIRKMLPST